MHPNADINAAIKDGDRICNSILSLLPRSISTSDGSENGIGV